MALRMPGWSVDPALKQPFSVLGNHDGHVSDLETRRWGTICPGAIVTTVVLQDCALTDAEAGHDAADGAAPRPRIQLVNFSNAAHIQPKR